MFHALSTAASGMTAQQRFRTDVDDVSALVSHHLASANRALRRKTDALSIPGVCRKIDHAHDGGLRVEGKVLAADGEFLDARFGDSPILFEQISQLFQSQHGGQRIAIPESGKPELTSPLHGLFMPGS